jgi:serine/threonine-protein kinase
MVAAALALTTVVLGWRAAHPPDAPLKPLIRLDADLGPDAITADYNTFAISPEGDRLVFTIRGVDGKTRLATRLLSDGKPTILEGTENPRNPFFSPDGAWIAYWADGKLRKVATRGGAPVVICDAIGFWGGAWTDDGALVVSLSRSAALARVAASGGSPTPLGKLSGSDATQRWPQALPGGEHVLASAAGSGDFGSATIIAVSTKTGEARHLVEGAYAAHYVAGPVAEPGRSTGHLLYLRGASLFAVGFDPTTLEIQGYAVPVADEVGGNSRTGAGHWDVSRNGVLLHRRGRPANQTWPVVWMDRTGETRPLVAEHQVYGPMRFSPDGNLLAISVTADGGADMFVYDLARDTTSRLSSAGKRKQVVDRPIWSPDGKHIISMYPGPSGFGLAWYRADGGGEPQILLDSNVLVYPTSVSPDGTLIAYTRVDPVSAHDIWVLPLDATDPGRPKAGKPEVFLQSPAIEVNPEFSPDGRWIAYYSNETGGGEAYVRPYPGPGGKWQVSKDGGTNPLWSEDGRSLYFLSPDSHIMVVDYATKGDVFSPGKARQWSPAPIWNPTNNLPYALHPDGKRFAVIPVPETAPEEKGNAHVTFLLNFGDELRRKAPLGK